MKCIFVLLIAVVAVKGQGRYKSVQDDLDVEALVADDDQFKNFIDCFADAAPCTSDAAAFKSDVRDVIIEACAECTPAQKHIVKVFTEGFKKKMPQYFEMFKDKFDPERKYFPKLEAVVAAY